MILSMNLLRHRRRRYDWFNRVIFLQYYVVVMIGLIDVRTISNRRHIFEFVSIF